MTGIAVAVDSNLMLLLVVGLASRDFIAKHKRLQAFTADDFDLLLSELAVASEVLVTPNVLTETSNLIDHIADPARTQVYERFRDLLSTATAIETHVPSLDAVHRSELPRLGLSDCALLELAARGIPLVTVDLHLYLAAAAKGYKALNFNHMRDASLL